MDLTTTTNASGQINVAMPFVGTGVQYQLRVYAQNPSVKLFTDPPPFAINPFYSVPGTPGAAITRVTISPMDNHSFTFHYTDTTSTANFNIADAIQRGASYAAANRDPMESDTLGQVAVSMQTVTAASWYDPVTKVIRLRPEAAMNDFSVLHEYAHYLEERISGFVGLAAVHDGCTAVFGASDVMDPGYAWMEGFADYFPHAVQRALPGTLNGSHNPSNLESVSCPKMTKPRASVEKFVAAGLFDLMDSAADGGDSFCAAGSVPADRLVFQIFDRELDIGFANPSLQHFANAWAARGFDIPMLRRTFDTHGISLVLPTPMTRFDMSPAANLTVFRPIGAWNSQWFVWGGQMPVTDWGRAGDVPVPADYDGDGLTDLAIWRPGDGMWWIIKTGSNQWSQQQWGTYGDIPVPADYDGDNEIDYAVYRPSTQRVYVFNDGCGFNQEIIIGSGTPVVGDFDADGFDEPGVFNQYGQFVIKLHTGATQYAYLPAGGTPVVRDYDGDLRADFAIFNSNTGVWYWTRSTSPGPVSSMQFGQYGDIPVPADYDGDTIAQFATWTPSTGYWRIRNDTNTVTSAYQWGQAGDIPVPAP